MAAPSANSEQLISEGLRLHEQGDLEGAREKYSIALKETPQHPDALHLMGLILLAEGALNSARRHIEMAIEQRDDISIYFNNLSVICRAQGDAALALVAARRAVALAPTDVGALTTLGVALQTTKEFQESIDTYRGALRIDPSAWQATLNLATVHLEIGELAQAENTFKSLLTHSHAGLSATLGLAKTFLERGRPEDAIRVLEPAGKKHPTHSDIALTLAEALLKSRDTDRSLEIISKALDLNPDRHALRNFRGHVLRELGQPNDAIMEFEKILESSPKHTDALVNSGLTYLALGNFKKGWRAYRYRSQQASVQERTPRVGVAPLGEDAITGKDLVVWTEQGLGDEILQASLIPDLRAIAKSVSVLCSARMVGLFEQSFPGLKVIDKESPGQTFDSGTRCSPLLDTAIELRPDRSSFPNHNGYLVADPDSTDCLRQRYIGAKPEGSVSPFLVGLSWRSGNAEYGADNTIELDVWQPLLEVARESTRKVLFIALQYDATAADAAKIPEGLRQMFFIDPSVKHQGDLAEVAAQVAACDLVISTSTTTAQIAGALGKPTWHLPATGLARGWYWGFDKDETPWYPSMRQFQRRSRVGVREQVEGIARALRDLLTSLEE